MRRAVLLVAVLFIVLMGYLTVVDFAENGVTLMGVLAVVILLLLSIGILGALRNPPHK